MSRSFRMLANYIGSTAFGLAITMGCLSWWAPRSITSAELDELTAGTYFGFGGATATNPTSNAANACYYCFNLPLPASGSLGCLDPAQYLAAGVTAYVATPGVSCFPELRFAAPNCPALGGVSTGLNCTTKKTVYTDP